MGLVCPQECSHPMVSAPSEQAATPTESAVDMDAALREAYAALDQGEVERARELSHRVLHVAEASANRHAEARALACLAHCDRMVSRIRRAHDTSRRAAQLFQLLGDIAGESTALVTLAHTASSLGRNEEAVESALLSVQLSQLLPLQKQQALAQNYLGIAYFWSRSFDRAAAAFQASTELAQSCSPPVSTFQPRHNLMWSEAVRFATERHDTGRMPDPQRMAAATDACGELVHRGEMGGIMPGIHVTAESMWRLASSLRYCWLGEHGPAASELEAARTWIEKYQSITWLHALQHWVETELAWARSDWPAAERSAEAMIDVATYIEHEQSACLGHLIASQIFEQQGQGDRALEEIRRLRRREQKIRAESLESRARVVKWQLDIRNTEESLHKLETTTRQLERLSLEDALTGLANRRCFEQQLVQALAALADGRKPLSLALIDVDKFKQINDGHSHLVGDQVLKGIAQVLRSQVREQDLPARLAGDEFVVIFPNAGAAEAARACRRIAAAVKRFDWATIAPGLAVSISIGAAQAQSGDSVESLLLRADSAMYDVKHGRAGH